MLWHHFSDMKLILYQFEASFTARHGRITEAAINYNNPSLISSSDEKDIAAKLLDRPLHAINNWEDELGPLAGTTSTSSAEQAPLRRAPGIGLNSLFGNSDPGILDSLRRYFGKDEVKEIIAAGTGSEKMEDALEDIEFYEDGENDKMPRK